jgi:hypothetical protein
MRYEVEILNPTAIMLLHDLADFKLISIKQNSEDSFLKIVAAFLRKLDQILPL